MPAVEAGGSGEGGGKRPVGQAEAKEKTAGWTGRERGKIKTKGGHLRQSPDARARAVGEGVRVPFSVMPAPQME